MNTDLPPTNGTSSGTLQIWGSETAISDITRAAGWEIIGCDPNALEQEIRLVCTSSFSASCDHLYQDTGPEGKIVRMPESCGKSAFARVARAWIPEDQSMPVNLAARLAKGHGGMPPQVKALQLDTQFHAINTTNTGPVNFAIRAATIPGANGDILSTRNSTRKSARSDGVEEHDYEGTVDDAIGYIRSLNGFDINKSHVFKPIVMSKKDMRIFRGMISCGPLLLGAQVDAIVDARVQAAIGVAASGTIIPPSLKAFAIVTGLSVDVEGTVNLLVDVAAFLDTDKITILELGLPGLSFPGVLTLGPSLQLNLQAKLTVDLAVGAHIGINYHLHNALLVFPPRPGHSSRIPKLSPGNTPLQLKTTPFVRAIAMVEGHISPAVNLGVSAFGRDVTVFVSVDSWAVLRISLEGDGKPKKNLSDTVDNSGSTVGKGDGNNFTPIPIPSSAAYPSPDMSVAGTDVTTTAVSDSVSSAKGPSLTGCFEVDVNIDINAGAEANFFGLFDTGTTVTFLRDTMVVFKKCFTAPSLAALNGTGGERSLSMPTNLRSLPRAGIRRPEPAPAPAPVAYAVRRRGRSRSRGLSPLHMSMRTSPSLEKRGGGLKCLPALNGWVLVKNGTIPASE
ncbi:hypothetical protein AX17_005571 [Amanita inopinata Kibby_2008]|nr:hypothetical protein AX17_005571 [Amanita inopinata Kibby_2008]